MSRSQPDKHHIDNLAELRAQTQRAELLEAKLAAAASERARLAAELNGLRVKLTEVRANAARLREAVLRGISALNHLPPDEGPIRRLAKEAIDFMRTALADAKEETK